MHRIEAVRSERGFEFTGFWNTNDDGKPDTEYPAELTIRVDQGRVEVQRRGKTGVSPVALMTYREVVAGMVREVHNRPDDSEVAQKAMEYMQEHLSSLQTTDRTQVNEDYYAALLSAHDFLRSIGHSDPLGYIATITGVTHATLRTRFYTAERQRDAKS